MPPGQFTVLVFDQGEPGRRRGDFTGDVFSIELFGGPYNGYTRGGYIEGGNIQVEQQLGSYRADGRGAASSASCRRHSRARPGS